jgi:ABC-2 type transport system permease protein
VQDVIAKKITNLNSKVNLDTLAMKSTVKSKYKFDQSSGEQSMKGLNEIKIAIGGGFGYLIMMFIIIYGNMVMRSVIEEKLIVLLKLFLRSNLSLMIGKIVGTSLAGILQF